MDNKQQNDLWQGGPWEQPSPMFTPPPAIITPSGSAPSRRPVLRTRRRRRRWLRVLVLLLVVGTLIPLGLFLDRNLSVSLKINAPTPPWLQALPSIPGQSQENSTQSASTDSPTIPRAETGTGVTLDLLPAGDETLTHTQIYSKCFPSMVSLEILSNKGLASASGIILTEDGYILTNAHVLLGGKSVDVLFSDNRVLPAQLVGFAPDDDLAVLKVDAHGLTPAQFGDSDLLQCGDPVSSLGDSLGYRASLTDGIISALDRELEIDNTNMLLIQTSAAINYGNSGGALINQYGQVVGVTTIKIISNDGSAESMGFAIPSQRVKFVVDSLIAGEAPRAAAFGITVSTYPVEAGGLEVLEVAPNSDAWAKGLRAGDRLVTLEGSPILSSVDLSRAKQNRGLGDTVSFTYIRNGSEFPIEITLMLADDVAY